MARAGFEGRPAHLRLLYLLRGESRPPYQITILGQKPIVYFIELMLLDPEGNF